MIITLFTCIYDYLYTATTRRLCITLSFWIKHSPTGENFAWSFPIPLLQNTRISISCELEIHTSTSFEWHIYIIMYTCKYSIWHISLDETLYQKNSSMLKYLQRFYIPIHSDSVVFHLLDFMSKFSKHSIFHDYEYVILHTCPGLNFAIKMSSLTGRRSPSLNWNKERLHYNCNKYLIIPLIWNFSEKEIWWFKRSP